MREIKFRAWNGYVMFNVDVLAISKVGWDSDGTGVSLAYQPHVEVMQWTGLLDSRGVEIYEGDICSTDLSRPYNIVVFRNGAFMYQCNDNGKDYFDIMVPINENTEHDRYTEVIGNLYENPELLNI